MVLEPNISLSAGGLNLIGSRLLILSKNSEVFLAGVEGIRVFEVRSRVSTSDRAQFRLIGVSMSEQYQLNFQTERFILAIVNQNEQ